MTLRSIAINGMKGRKKDSLILRLVIILSFTFIVSSLIFQASFEQTRIGQRKELYGSWQAAYLGGYSDTYESLSKEEAVKTITHTQLLGKSDKLGMVGTLSPELLNMGNYTLYTGDFPQTEDEIAVELNQLTEAGLEIKVGQKITVDIVHIIFEQNISQYQDEQYRQAMSEGRELQNYGYGENPGTDVGDVYVIVTSNYEYFFNKGDDVRPEIIKEKGMLTLQKVVLRKEFTISGILNTYSDKWDTGGYPVPNSFVTEEAGEALEYAFYNNEILNVDDYKLPVNVFMQLHTMDSEIFRELAEKYLDTEEAVTVWLENESENSVVVTVTTTGSDPMTQLLPSIIAENTEVLENLPREEDKGIIEGSVTESADIYSRFRRNSFTYPDTENSVDHIITTAILGIIFIATICAVFHIFLTQMKRRSRKIVLLKSIGATRLQVSGILIWEAVYVWLWGIGFGLAAGSTVSIAALYMMRWMGNPAIAITIPYKMVMIGLLAGSGALFGGIILPAAMTVNIPLTGTAMKIRKHKKAKPPVHNRRRRRDAVKQSFLHITLRYMKDNRGKNLLSFALSLFIISILTISIYLSYQSFERYRDEVDLNGRPDYTMKAVYGESQRKLDGLEEELKSIDGVIEVDTYKYGRDLLLWYEGIHEDPLLKAYHNLLPELLKPQHFSRYRQSFGQWDEWIRDAYYTTYYGIDPEDADTADIFSSITEGSINMEKFIKGEEVILLMPLYREGTSAQEAISGTARPYDKDKVVDAAGIDKRFHWLLKDSRAYDSSTDRRYRELYSKTSVIKPGDTLYLSTEMEKIVGMNFVLDFYSSEVTVGGIIHYFPEEGIWPFSNITSQYAVIGSMRGMETLYPKSKMGLYRIDIETMKTMADTLYKSSYGRTMWNIRTENTDNPKILDAALTGFANNNGFTIYNYRESSQRVYGEALNNILIICLLGFASSLIAILVLYNTFVSRMEQEKNRIGILQSQGVTNSQFAAQYIFSGITQGLSSVVIINIALFTLLALLTAVTSKIPVSNLNHIINEVMVSRLWLYPWMLHLLVSVLFVVLITILQLVPAIRIVRRYPVDNIRSFDR